MGPEPHSELVPGTLLSEYHHALLVEDTPPGLIPGLNAFSAGDRREFKQSLNMII